MSSEKVDVKEETLVEDYKVASESKISVVSATRGSLFGFVLGCFLFLFRTTWTHAWRNPCFRIPFRKWIPRTTRPVISRLFVVFRVSHSLGELCLVFCSSFLTQTRLPRATIASTATFIFVDEDHTLGNTLRYFLMRKYDAKMQRSSCGRCVVDRLFCVSRSPNVEFAGLPRWRSCRCVNEAGAIFSSVCLTLMYLCVFLWCACSL